MSDRDRGRGLYAKYRVMRNDGSSEKGGRHEHCEYFVLDLSHDPHAIPALRAYAESCQMDFPFLARDLLEKIDSLVSQKRGELSKKEIASALETAEKCSCCGKRFEKNEFRAVQTTTGKVFCFNCSIQ